MMSDNEPTDDCCCFLFTNSKRRHRTRLQRRQWRSRLQSSSHSRSHFIASGRPFAPSKRPTYPQAERQQQQPNNHTSSIYSTADCASAARRLKCEEIELQCWSLSPDCLLVNSDKRCRLINMCKSQTKARPLDDFEEGRRHLDVRRPENMSLIKFKIDRESGQIERRLSIYEINDDENEFLELLCPETPEAEGQGQNEGDYEPAAGELERQRRCLKIAQKLSSRSFLVIERDSITATGADPEQSFRSAHATSGNEFRATKQEIDHRNLSYLEKRPENDLESCQGEKNDRDQQQQRQQQPLHSDLERELISTISIERAGTLAEYEPAAPALPAPPPSFHSHKQEGKRKRSKLHLKIARRFYKLIGSGGSPGGQNQHGSSSIQVGGYSALSGTCICEQESLGGGGDETPALDSGNFIAASYQEVDFDAHGVPQMIAPPTPPPSGDLYRQLVPLTRPESLYFCPKRLAEGAFLPNQSFAGYQQQQQQLQNRQQHICMISYNHAEAREYAIALHARLEQLGVSAYLDLYDIRQGEDWQDSLNFAILNCAVFIALVTPSYGETLWTSRECKLADVLAKRIVPINFGQKWPPARLAIQFATLQYIDWLHFDSDSLAVLEPERRHQRPAHEHRVLTQSHFLLARPEWPADCVLSVAAQIEKSLQLELEAYFRPAGSALPAREQQQQASWNSDWTNSANGPSSLGLMWSGRAIKPASLQTDSGYESPSEKRAHANGRLAATETDSILNTSIQSNQSGSSLGRKLLNLAVASGKTKKSSESSAVSSGGDCVPRPYGAIEHQQPESLSSDEPNSAEVICAPAELNGFRLTRTRPKQLASGDQQSQNQAQTHTQKQQSESGRYSANGSSLEQDSPLGDSEQAPHKQQDAVKTARKRSLGHKAKKVLSRVKRSLNATANRAPATRQTNP